MLLINIYLNMKKLIFGAAALLFTGASFAQLATAEVKTATNGTNADEITAEAALPQTGGFWGNTGKSVQEGTDQKVYVAQAGSNNSVFTDQANGSGDGENKARIWQTGNVLPDSGFENLAEVIQRGTNNQSTTQQEGDWNMAITRQGLKDDSSEGNRAYINHGIAEQGEGNYVMVEQDGLDNRSKTVQVYDNSDARTIQEGEANMADIRQDAGPNQSSGHTALVEQYGDENASRVRQYGSARNSAHSAQAGNNNKSNQNQTSDALSGIGNTGVVAQGTNPVNAQVASAFVYMDTNVDDISNGTPNFLGTSDDNKALQNQNGEGNAGYIGQWGDGDGNYGEQNQDGKNSTATMIQNSYGNPSGGNNYARQDQTGDDHEAMLSQNGFSHSAYQRQYGAENFVASTQRGNSNLVSTYQDGSVGKGNAAHTAQRGSDNQILLVQKGGFYGGNSYVVEQGVTGPAGSASGNQANILQLGPAGDFVNDAEACDFQDPQDLIMPGGVGSFDLDAPCVDNGGGC